MRRLGANVWPLNTVQFSNHTQYGQWTGCVMPPAHLTEIVQGIAAIDQLKGRCDAVLSGYLGSAEQGEHILGIVRQVKAAKPQAKFSATRLWGTQKRAASWRQAWRIDKLRYAMPASDIIAPNLIELKLAGREREDPVNDAGAGCA
ncbi:pyridoxal kinase [Escherichia coli]